MEAHCFAMKGLKLNFHTLCNQTIDKVYIDGPCELLIWRSIDKVYIDGPWELLIWRSIDKVYIDGPCELLIWR